MARPRNAGPAWPKCLPFPAAIEFKRSYSLLRTAVPSFERARATRAELRSGTCTQGVFALLQCVDFEFSHVTTMKSDWQITEWFAKSGTNREAKERECSINRQHPVDSPTSDWCWKRWEDDRWKTRKSGVWGEHRVSSRKQLGLHLLACYGFWTVGKELGTMALPPSLASMKALQNKIAVVKQQKQDMAEQEARRQADDAPGAAHCQGQFQRQKRLAQAAAAAAAEKARQKEAAEAQ
eukprot:1926754-Rhodomonas_salina.1